MCHETCFIRWIYLRHSPNSMYVHQVSKKVNFIILMLFICINLLYIFICESVLDFSLLLNYSHIFLCFCCYTVVLSCLYQISSCTWLGIILLWFRTFITCNTLDMFCILFVVVIVDSWNVNKISNIRYLCWVLTPTAAHNERTFSYINLTWAG